jgi:hypothetical protein
MNTLVVQQTRNEEGREDAGKVCEKGRESAGADGKVLHQPRAHEAVVEIADEESWDEKQNSAASEELADGLEFSAPGGGFGDDDARAVFTPNLVCGTEAQRDGETEVHEDDEDDVCRAGDGASRFAVCVEAKVDGAADDGARGLCCLPDGQVVISLGSENLSYVK